MIIDPLFYHKYLHTFSKVIKVNLNRLSILNTVDNLMITVAAINDPHIKEIVNLLAAAPKSLLVK
jgi:hypothetical protein